jgi:hypothetical protein
LALYRRLATLCLLGLALPPSVFGQSPEDRFWKWFQAHDAQILAIKTGEEPIGNELAAELHRVHPALTWEVGPTTTGRRDFVLSADGIKAAFPSVIALGHSAPALPHWNLIRFRPPRPDVTRIKVAGVELDSKQLEFLSEPDGAKVGLTISVPGYKPTPAKSYEQAIFLLLDTILGEYAVETAIGFVNIIGPEKRPAGRWRPLPTLPTVVKSPTPP